VANIGSKIGMKILTIAVGIPVGIATRKAVEKAWLAAGPDRPHKPSDEGVEWADALAWALVTAVGMVVADLITRKGAEEAYRTLVGSEPPVPAKPKASKKVRKADPEHVKDGE
jgi:hypothetical protein